MKIMLINIALLISVSTLALSGCSTNTQRENTTVGAVSGAVVGGLAGSLFGGGTGRVVAIGVGAVAGALAGGAIGHNMESTDNNSMNDAMSNNNTNQKSSWNNKRTNVNYTMKPTSKVFAYQGQEYCRRYETSATVSGQHQVASGIACRQPNGVWQTMNANS